MERMSTETIVIRAKIRLLPTSESDRTAPIRGSYRPNHNFFGPDNHVMTIGCIELPDGKELHPGESTELQVTFLNWSGLDGQIYPGREWRIQEGPKLVATGTVIEVLPTG